MSTVLILQRFLVQPVFAIRRSVHETSAPAPSNCSAPGGNLIDHRGKMMQDGADSYVRKRDTPMQYAALIRQLEDAIEGARMLWASGSGPVSCGGLGECPDA